ncbi:abortive infection protein [Salinarchaeum sp. Harcht-Bsk1]|uniref:CPBP family intramembrane glutamic endopeptidase n=1 Tax=Salinarchaeum sp. Harcht-Bsk1 TaxID=1333523 RepID=UPI0003422EC4|nr:CPBP family intramembrane glutamic endopeptidase [Salinarchaeum sp. Harcht-Bsk1]AGN02577.1 abortive infection protein [Salinarchaeum sp. Harcht-Bsk1]
MNSEVATDRTGTAADSRFREAVLSFVLGASGYVGIQLTALVLVVGAIGFAGSLTDMEANVVAAVGTGVGAVFFALVYFEHSRHDASFLDLDPPGLRDVGYVVLGVVVLVGALFAISIVANALGLGLSNHSLADTAESADPLIVALLIPASILFVGPGEELVFRNVVQKRLGESFSTWGAIGLASVAFAAIHFPAYATGSLSQILASLVVVFTLSILLGWLYVRTEKLFVPALTHGIYNAIQFTILYVEVASVGLPG